MRACFAILLAACTTDVSEQTIESELTSVNFALTSNGSTLTASSSYTAYPATRGGDNDTATFWTHTPGNSAPASNCWYANGNYPWLKSTFAAARTINAIEVVMPSAASQKLVHFHMQYCPANASCSNALTGTTGWVQPTGGYVTYNTQTSRIVTFSPVAAKAVRVWAECSGSAMAYVSELRAWGNESCSNCGGSIEEPPPPSSAPACASSCTADSPCDRECSVDGLRSFCGNHGVCESCADKCTWTSSPAKLCLANATVSKCGVSGRSSAPVAVDIFLPSGRRALKQGTDGGHVEPFCSNIDQASMPCTPTEMFDGLQLVPDPSGAWASSSDLPAVAPGGVVVKAIEGPHMAQIVPFKWEWREGADPVEYTYRRYDLVTASFPSVTNIGNVTGKMTFYWDEDEGWRPDADDFNWTAPMGDYINTCLAGATTPWTRYGDVSAARSISNTYGPLGPGFPSPHGLCDSRGCTDGEYAVEFNVACRFHY